MGAYIERWIRDYLIFYNIDSKTYDSFIKERDKDKNMNNYYIRKIFLNMKLLLV